MFTQTKRNEGGMAEGVLGGSGKARSATVIAQGVKVEGDFASDGDVTIEGEVLGTIKVSGVLSIGSQARLKANVSAAQAIIAGAVEGNITVQTHVDLKATAKLTGDVSCETLSVESGAKLNGKTTVGGQTGMDEKNNKRIEK